jgi:hypothetical protein
MIDFDEIERRLDDVLENETSDSLNQFFNILRQRHREVEINKYFGEGSFKACKTDYTELKVNLISDCIDNVAIPAANYDFAMAA